MRGLVHEVAKFASVGLVAYVIDVFVFNLVLFTAASPLYDKPLSSKALSVFVAATFAYFANRHWTWKDRARTGLGREYLLFFVVNGIGMLIAVACLWISHYVLGFQNPLADNISANGFGLVLGTAFRFWAYRTFVFKADDAA